jgi:hypothetical protein
MTGKFPGIDTGEENITETPQSEETQFKAIPGSIEDKILRLREIVSSIQDDYKSQLLKKIKADSKKIWESEDYIEQVIRDHSKLPEVHVSAKHKHLNDFNVKMFIKTSKDIDNLIELLFTYL